MDEDAVCDLILELDDAMGKQPRPAKAIAPQQDDSEDDEDARILLAELDGATPPRAPLSVSARSKPAESDSSIRRCMPHCIGGSGVPLGLSASGRLSACDKLRCTSCDFRIVSFPDSAWHRRTDYLFLRNNIPDAARLRPNLLRHAGSVAYACQCHHRSVSGPCVPIGSDLPWRCGGH